MCTYILDFSADDSRRERGYHSMFRVFTLDSGSLDSDQCSPHHFTLIVDISVSILVIIGIILNCRNMNEIMCC